MEKHPLQYFKDLILRNQVPNERLKFLMNPEFTPVVKKDLQNDTIEYAINDVLTTDSDVKIGTVTFSEKLEAKAFNEMLNAFDLIVLPGLIDSWNVVW